MVAVVAVATGCTPDPGTGTRTTASTSTETPTPSHGSLSPTTPATTSAQPSPAADAAPQLPRGGRTILPAHRLVGYAGAPGSAALGRLGVGELDDRAEEIEKLGRAHAGGRRPLPVLELIATVVQASPGRDGKYRTRMSAKVIDEHLAAARRAKGLLLLNIQPGRATFMEEVKAYARWLEEPDVGVALDPEWAMGPRQVPMQVFGHVTGKQIDAVAAHLSTVVKANDLPEKVLVFHQLASSIVSDENDIQTHPGVVIIKSVDGIGSRAQKTSTWTKLTTSLPPAVRPGFKLFLEEDRRHGPLMTPKEVLALRPEPDYVLYE